MDLYPGNKHSLLEMLFPSTIQISHTCRTHGNSHCQPHNALNVNDVEHLKKFLTNHAEENAVHLPGRVPGYKHYKVLLLPSSCTKRAIWELYRVACERTSVRVMGYSSFCKLWKKYVPYIVVAKPKSDLCWVCMKNNSAIARTSNLPEVSTYMHIATYSVQN